MINCIILAAGYATRLYPLTIDKPKALLPIGGQPLLNRLLKQIEGVENLGEVALVTNSRFYKIFSDWASDLNFPKKIKVIDDGTDSNDNRLGAIGDLKFAIDKLEMKGDLLVLASDNLFEQDLKKFCSTISSHPDAAVIGVYDIKDPSLAAGRYGVVHTDTGDRITAIEEKPEHPSSPLVSMGVYGFSGKAVELIDEYSNSPEKKDAPGHYAQWLLQRVPVFASLFSGKWYDIGSLDQLTEADKAYTQQ